MGKRLTPGRPGPGSAKNQQRIDAVVPSADRSIATLPVNEPIGDKRNGGSSLGVISHLERMDVLSGSWPLLGVHVRHSPRLVHVSDGNIGATPHNPGGGVSWY
jgi:hypothetical protein